MALGDQWELGSLIDKTDDKPVKEMLAAFTWNAKQMGDIWAYAANASMLRLMLAALPTKERAKGVEKVVRLLEHRQAANCSKPGCDELLAELTAGAPAEQPKEPAWRVPANKDEAVRLLEDASLDAKQTSALAKKVGTVRTEHHGVPTLHIAALAGNPHVVDAWDLDLAMKQDGYPPNASFYFGKDEHNSPVQRTVKLLEGDTALDAVDAKLELAYAALAAGGAPVGANPRTIPMQVASLETLRDALVAAGCKRNRTGSTKMSPLQTRIAALARACQAPAAVIAQLARPSAQRAAPQVLIELMGMAQAALALAAKRQKDPFWRTVLAAPPSTFHLLGGTYDEVHLFDSTTEKAYEWSSRTKAIDVALWKPAARKALAKLTPLAADEDHVWFVDTKHLVRVVSGESTTLTALGTIDAMLASATE